MENQRGQELGGSLFSRENQVWGKPCEGKLEFLEDITGSIWEGRKVSAGGAASPVGQAGVRDAQRCWAQRALQKLPLLAQLSEKSSTSMWEEALWLCFYLLKEASSSHCILSSFLGLFINLTSRPANPEP